MLYAAVGPSAKERAEQSVGSYYAFLGPNLVRRVLSTCAVGEDALAAAIAAFAQAGADDLLLTPCSADPAQLDLIADVALTSPSATPKGHLA